MTVKNVATGEIVLQEVSKVGPGVPPPSPPPTAAYKSVFLASGADCSGGPCCLDLSYWKTSDHANVAISNCHPTSRGDNQLWALNGSQLVVKLDGKCLTAGATQIEVNACNPADATQHWAYKAGTAPGPIMQGGQCLTAEVEQDGGALKLAACLPGSPGQSWTASSSPPPGPTVPSVSVAFASPPNEKIFGFGEHQQGHLDNKNLTYDMESCLDYGKSRGGEVCLPYIMGSTGARLRYGFLWNMPNYGGVSFAGNATTWKADAATQVDYFITVPGAADTAAQSGGSIMNNYVDAVGHAPVLPEYAMGYWHSKNRYSTQADLLAAAEGFYNRSINVSIIVIDYHHWVGAPLLPGAPLLLSVLLRSGEGQRCA